MISKLKVTLLGTSLIVGGLLLSACKATPSASVDSSTTAETSYLNDDAATPMGTAAPSPTTSAQVEVDTAIKDMDTAIGKVNPDDYNAKDFDF